MRRTNTDYKFNEENPNTHYLSTHSLKSNDNNDSNTQSNLEFNYYFNHLCHIDDHNDICHKVTLSSTYESGIGSSISSIDAHCNLSGTSEESSVHGLDSEHLMSPGIMFNNLYSHFDYHDLPPVTEEEDNDSILGIFNNSEKDNKHLDYLPWHEQCFDCSLYVKGTSDAIDNTRKNNSFINSNHWWEYCALNYDDNYVSLSADVSHDDHIEKPWISNTSNFIPVLSSICHRSEDCLLKSETFLTHLTNANMISNKAMMYKVFRRRHSVKNGSTMFTYNIKSLITMDSNLENNFYDDEYIQGSLSD